MPYHKNLEVRPLFSRWREMKRRCSSRARGYEIEAYVNKGIKVCWPTFKEFRVDMEASFNEHVKKFGNNATQIDRIDNDGPYSKENCRWVTPSENSINRKTTRWVEFEGVLTPLTYISKKIFGNRTVIHERLNRGWSLEKAINTPKKKYSKKIRRQIPINSLNT